VACGLTEVDGCVDEGGDNHAPDGCGDGECCLFGAGEFADDHFSFDFESDDEEEDGHEGVVDPSDEMVGDVDLPEEDFEFGAMEDVVVEFGEAGVGPDDGQDGASEQEDAARDGQAHETLDRFDQAFGGFGRGAMGGVRNVGVVGHRFLHGFGESEEISVSGRGDFASVGNGGKKSGSADDSSPLWL